MDLAPPLEKTGSANDFSEDGQGYSPPSPYNPPQVAPAPAYASSSTIPRHISLNVNYPTTDNDLADGRFFDASKVSLLETTAKRSRTERLKSIFSHGFPKAKNTAPPKSVVRVVVPAVVELGSNVVGTDCVRGGDQRAVVEGPETLDIHGNRVVPVETNLWLNRQNTKTKRAVIIDLKHEPTLSEISTVCKNTGKLEKTEISETNNHAKVWFLEEEGAARFMKLAQSHITYQVADSNYRRARSTLIDAKYNWPIEKLDHRVLERIKADDITRCIVIRGLISKKMYNPNLTEDEERYFKAEMWDFAKHLMGTDAIADVESVSIGYVNGRHEIMIVYTDILVAIHVFDFMRSEAEFDKCTIWYGVDPVFMDRCEPPRMARGF
ncbi:hypothetical protein DFP73DRAFT_529965 [Morchella snyderi]|nr:hypothetical protein DFP73DRAFT_529965 [Morchella snyderi]